jgi:dephospho-CoA kinase
MIIGLTGLPASGKGTSANYLIEKYGAQSIRFSDPLRDINKRLYQDSTRENMSHLAQFLRGEFGNDILIQVLLQDIKHSEKKLFVLDGMRYKEEFEVLSQRGDFKMWAIDTSIGKRHQRIIARDENESDKTLTMEQFKNQHQLPTELFIPKLMKQADEVIDNNGSLEELTKKIDKIIAQYEIQSKKIT